MKRLCMLLFFAVLLLPAVARSQVVTGRFSASAYGWERQDDTLGGKTSHLRGYGALQLDVGGGMFSFHTSMQGTTDFGEKMDSDPALRLYNMYVSARGIANMVDVRIGRMPVYAGVSWGSIDGAQLKLTPAKTVEVMVYGGGLTPPSQRTDFLHNLDRNWQAGGQIVYLPTEHFRLGLSYMNRHRESVAYNALRPDNLLGSQVLTHIDYGTRANQYASLNASWTNKDLFTFGRVDYDLNFERLARVEVSGYYQATEKLGCMLNLAHREPTISYNSYFAMFEAEANQEAIVGVDYKLHPRVTLQGRFSTVLYDGETAYRVSIGASNKYASIMYTKDVSYDGGLDGFNVDLTYPLFEGRLVPHVGAVYSSYALGENFETTSTMALVGGLMYRPMRILSFDVQGQYLTNKIYDSDTRVFFRANYWFSNVFGVGKEGKQ